MAFSDFTAGDVFTAADADVLMRQSIMRFDDASARDTALSGVLAEGMVAYLDDVDLSTVYDGSAWLYRPGLLYEGTIDNSVTADQSTTPVAIDTEVFDAGSIGGAGSSTLTVPQAGVYLLSVELTRTSGSGEPVVRPRITTGVDYFDGVQVVGGGSVSGIAATARLAASDVITLNDADGLSSGGDYEATVRLYLLT